MDTLALQPEAARPKLVGAHHSRPNQSMNWKCESCAMHFAYGRLVPVPAHCDRCGGKIFSAYE
jgi:hypothetical protein